VRKIIIIIYIYALLLCSVTSLHATQNKQGRNNNNIWQKYQKQNWSGNNAWENKFSGYSGWEYKKTWDDGNKNRWKQNFSRGNGNYKLQKKHWKKLRARGGNNGCKPIPPGCNAPEPISSALFVLGGAGLGLYKKFKNKD